MKNKNSCYTYFRIVGNFEPDEITEILLNLHTGIMGCVMLVFLKKLVNKRTFRCIKP